MRRRGSPTRTGAIIVALGAMLVAVFSPGSSTARAGAAVTLPDLKVLVPTGLISIGTDPGDGQRALRFTHLTADVGSGPFEIDPTYNPHTGTATFVQVIYNSPSPGVWARDHTVPVAATGVWRPPSDYDFPLTRFTLNTVNPDGSPGRVVATSPKSDYCITGDYRLDGVPDTPDSTSPSPSNCSDPNAPLGWSVGWADQYDQTDSGQPIDLNGIPDGTYILHAVVDPEHVFTESNTANDVTDTKLQISGDTVAVISQSAPGASLPGVSVTSPPARTRVPIGSFVTLRASASATPPATVTSVQFLLDGQPIGAPVNRPPYTTVWPTADSGPGGHLVSARVADSVGNEASATPVPVFVLAARAAPGLRVRAVRWRAGTLELSTSGLPGGATLSVQLRFPRGAPRKLTLRTGSGQIGTPRPTVVVLRVLRSGRQVGRTLFVALSGRPTVHITSPLRGETLSGTVRLVATASDRVALRSVRFIVDGRQIGRPVTRPPFVERWRTARARRGRHLVSAVATNVTGNTATATVAVSVENPAPAMTCFVLQAHLNARGAGAVTTGPVRTALPGETLLAFVSADGPAGAGRQTAAVSGAGLRWRLIRRANRSSGDTEVWSATAPRVLAGARVSSRLADDAFNQSLTVIAMEGAAGIGSAAGASGPSGPAGAPLRTTGPASLVFAAGNDWDRAAARVLPPGWVMLDQWLEAASGDTYWSQYTNQTTGRAGSVVRAGVRAPTADQWNLVAVELRGERG